jgi:hypothetical protein
VVTIRVVVKVAAAVVVLITTTILPPPSLSLRLSKSWLILVDAVGT